ncbi:MAG TPA: hypothetical protein VHT91_34405 [Kofleriaceae bacterium]|nr:hypothetical protein [Kofleriaceae bacterium]
MALPIEAMIHAGKADDAIARTLLVRHNPVLQARLAEHHEEGVREGLARGVEDGFARGVAHAGQARADRRRARPARLERWLIAAATCADAHELWATTGGV